MLDAADRKALRARAHHLDPVIMIGEAGLTRAVLDETDRALRVHELIKVRVLGDDRRQRQTTSTEICSALGCAAVQSIGKLLVLYRPRPIEDASRPGEPHIPKKRAAQGGAAKSSTGAGKVAKRVARGATAARSAGKQTAVGATASRGGAKRVTGGATASRGAAKPTTGAVTASRAGAKPATGAATASRAGAKRVADTQRPTTRGAGARTAAAAKKQSGSAREMQRSSGPRAAKPSGTRATAPSGARATAPSGGARATTHTGARPAKPSGTRATAPSGARAAKRPSSGMRGAAAQGKRPTGRTKKG